MPDASVVICTRDRAAQLARMLESACRLVVPRGRDWELIVVDNGSSDTTPAVIAGFAARLPVRRIEEPEAGVARARNRGIAEARGTYICWTDDDVLLDPGWLAAYLAAFRRHPEAAIFGGPIEPRLEAPERPLFARCKDHSPLAGAYAKRDLGDSIIPLGSVGDRIPWGANFAVRSVEQRLHAFDPHLGPAPSQSRLGDEMDLIHRLLRARAQGWWVPDAKVTHVIAPARQTRAYVFDYYRRWGRTAAYLHARSPGDNAVEAVATPGFLTAGAIALGARLAWHAVAGIGTLAAGRPCSSLRHLASFASCVGIVEHRRAISGKERGRDAESGSKV